jgi:hypothetical protein
VIATAIQSFKRLSVNGDLYFDLSIFTSEPLDSLKQHRNMYLALIALDLEEGTLQTALNFVRFCHLLFLLMTNLFTN